MYVNPSAHRNNYRNTDVCYNVSTWWILNLSGVIGKVLARSLKADIRNLTTSIKCILWFEVPTSNETFSLYHRNFDNSTHLTPIYMLDLIHSTHFVAEIVNQYDVQRGQTMTLGPGLLVCSALLIFLLRFFFLRWTLIQKFGQQQ